MRKITRTDMGNYGCNYCEFYADKWSCALDECFFITEARQRQDQPSPTPQQTATWEVIR